jgi:hypothetical protein
MAPWLIITGSGLDNFTFLLTPSFTTSLSQLINLTLNPSSLTAEDSLRSPSHAATDFWFTTVLLMLWSRGGPIETHPLPSNWYMRETYKTPFPLLYLYRAAWQRNVSYCCLRIRCHWNVFSNPFPSNAHVANYIQNTFSNTFFYCCLRAFRTLLRNGSTCHIRDE